MGVEGIGRGIQEAIIGLVVLGGIIGCVLTFVAVFVIPWLWQFVKPWLHMVTA